jgi:hypothetical protein
VALPQGGWLSDLPVWIAGGRLKKNEPNVKTLENDVLAHRSG